MRVARHALWCVLLSLAGLGLSGYLTFLHFGLLRGELLGGPVCGGAGALNCHAVTAGPWGTVFGMPLALWGLLGYLVVLALALLGRQSEDWARHALTLIAVLSACFAGIDLILLGLMVFVIRVYCLFCLLTYVVNLSLLLVSFSAFGRPWSQVLRHSDEAFTALMPTRQRPAALLFWGLVLVGSSGTVALHASTTFVSQGTTNVRTQMREFITKQPRVSVDVTGDPMMGSSNAAVQMTEFSDFLCPACQRASQFNAIILANHRRDVRLVFKHYPLDTTCNDRVNRMVHPGACQVAAASECAHLQGKFWAFHDLVFEQGQKYQVVNIEADAMRIGLDMTRFKACMDAGLGLEAVKRDIAEGGRVGVSSTPTYVVNGIPAAGGFTPSRFEDFVAVLHESTQR